MKLFSIFDKYPEIKIDISTKSDGSMKPTGDISLDTEIYDNQNKFIQKLDIASNEIVRLGQVHDNNIHSANLASGGEVISNTDALIANHSKLFLSVRVADCVPIYFYDPTSGAIGIIHGGWRGLAKDITSETLGKARVELGLNPVTTIVGIGPAICGRDYEVGEDVVSKFGDFQNCITQESNKYFLDLKAVVKEQLLKVGIKTSNIETNNSCTFESDNFFSFRRDKPKFAQCMMTFVGKN